MSSKYQQNAKQSRKWFAPFGIGIVVGVVLTMVVGQFRSEMEEEATVANAALEGARPQDRAPQELAVRQPEVPAAPPPTAAEVAPSAPAAEPERAAPPAKEKETEKLAAAPSSSLALNAAPGAVAAAPTPRASAAVQPAPPPAAKAPAAALYAAAEKATQPLAPVTPAPALQLQARALEPAASSVVHAPPPTAAMQPTAAGQPKPSAAPVDPNSEEAKLAAAAQVRVRGDTPMDSMLDQALSGEKKAAAPASAAAPTLAQTPSRDDVVNTMSVLVPAIRGCAQGQSGLAPMSIVVQSDGRVESAALGSGPFQGTASGRCMEGVVRRARFPHFKQANFRVQFPFAVQ